MIEIPVKKGKLFENRINALKNIIEKNNLGVLYSDIIDRKGKKELKMIFKIEKDKKLDFQKIMKIKEKLNFKIELNPDII